MALTEEQEKALLKLLDPPADPPEDPPADPPEDPPAVDWEQRYKELEAKNQATEKRAEKLEQMLALKNKEDAAKKEEDDKKEVADLQKKFANLVF